MTVLSFHNASDLAEFQSGYEHYVSGRWFSDRWKTFRLRFGIYEQRQSGQHMVRVKVPGGRLSLDQARAIAGANAAHAGGDIHITTRQGVQLYFILRDNLPGLLNALAEGGVTTREASGSTFRAITACPHAGFCPHQLTDAATVAGQLTNTWLRHPLTQHMPRKFKTTVSGCARDCGLSAIDDLGFIAVERDGEKGFRVTAGGGLGIAPTQAVEVFDFVREEDLPRVQEAFARLHHKYSDRANKNRARIKFLLKQWGEAEFVARVREEFEALGGLHQPAWAALDWRAPETPRSRRDVEIDIPLGWLTSSQFSALTDAAAAAGGAELRLTRSQNLIAVGLEQDKAQAFVDAALALGLEPRESDPSRAPALSDLVACPGTSTCAIGITDSHALAQSLLAVKDQFVGLESVRLRVSGCHNSCGHHHIADIGLHGLAKKINGNPAPHYQFHLGGGAAAHGIPGPIVPAHRAKDALVLLLAAIKNDRREGETVRNWVERIGVEKIAQIVAPALEGDVEGAFTDIGGDEAFAPPATSSGECAAAAVVAEHLADLAQVARFDAARTFRAGRADQARAHLAQALDFPAQRLLVISGQRDVCEPQDRLAAVRKQWSHNAALLRELDQAEQAVAAGEVSAALPALTAWQTAVDVEVERLLTAIPTFLAGAAQ